MTRGKRDAETLTERVARAVFDRDNDAWRPGARDQMWPNVREEYLPYGSDALAVVADDVAQRCECLPAEPGVCGACQYAAYLRESGAGDE